jgi:hypothetical protein
MLGLGLRWGCALAHAVVELIPKIERGIAMGFNPGAQTGYSGPLTGERVTRAIVRSDHLRAPNRAVIKPQRCRWMRHRRGDSFQPLGRALTRIAVLLDRRGCLAVRGESADFDLAVLCNHDPRGGVAGGADRIQSAGNVDLFEK